ncbi:MAG: hypothetical protein M5U21_06945 [Fimbriimonadaceae bacterium]|nr:hypothetical protein [Fimbriimonadaceae bacterium]
MNAISRVTVFGLAIAVATGFALSQGQLLRLKLAEDSKDVYDVKMTGDTTIDVPGMGSQSVNFTGSMKYTIKVGKRTLSLASSRLSSLLRTCSSNPTWATWERCREWTAR